MAEVRKTPGFSIKWIGVVQFPILIALFVSACAEVRPVFENPLTEAPNISRMRESIGTCDYLKVFVSPASDKSYAIAVEYGLVSQERAKRAEELSRRLAESFSKSLDRRGFEVVDSPEGSYWLAKTQAEISGRSGKFIAVVEMRRAERNGPSAEPKEPSVSPNAPVEGFSALVESYRSRLESAASDVADKATLLFLPRAIGLCRNREAALEEEEIRRIREALVEEMRVVRHGKRKNLEFTVE